MTFFLALTLQCFFPSFDLSGSPGMAVVNNDADQRNYGTTVMSTEGVPVVTGRFSLAAGAQRAFMLQEMSGSVPLPASGSISVESESSSACTSYLAFADGDKLSGTDGASLPSTRVLLPYVDVNTGFVELSHTETIVAIVHPGTTSAPANVTAQLVGLDGVVRGSVPVTVPPRGTWIFRVSEAFSSFIRDNGVGGRTFQGYLRLNSDVGIVAWQRIETPLAQSLLKGKGSDEIGTTSMAMIPHFALSGVYQSVLNLLNPTGSPINLVVSAHDERGNVLGDPVNVRLALGEGKRSPVGEFFRMPIITIFPPPLITGYIRIREAQDLPFQIVGNVEIDTSIRGPKSAAMLYPVSDSGGNRWILPFASSVGSYFTGYAISNPNEFLAVQTDVTIEIVDRSGNVIGTNSVSLSRAARYAAMVPEGRSGYVRIRSNLPIHVLGAIGTKDGTTLDQIPALH